MLSDTLTEGLENYRIGPKIRDLRRSKGLGLSQLGDHTGLSAGMLSKIERGSVFPTLPTLLRIAMVFGVGLEHFFTEEDRPVLELVRRKDRLRLPDRQGAAPGYFFESLDFPVNDRPIEAFWAEFPPRKEPSEPHAHDGVELLYVISGTVEVHIHDRSIRIEAGDSIYFDADFPHSYRSAGIETATAMVVSAHRD